MPDIDSTLPAAKAPRRSRRSKTKPKSPSTTIDTGAVLEDQPPIVDDNSPEGVDVAPDAESELIAEGDIEEREPEFDDELEDALLEEPEEEFGDEEELEEEAEGELVDEFEDENVFEDELEDEDDDLVEELEEAPQEVPEEEPRPLTLAERHEQAHQALMDSERNLASARARVERTRERVEDAAERLDGISSARDSLATWINGRSRSLALKVLNHLSEQERILQADEYRLKSWVAQDLPLIQQRAFELKRGFLRAMLFGLIVPVIVTFLALILTSGGPSNVLARMIILVAVFVITYALVVLGALKSYHRGYSALLAELRYELARGQHLLASISSIRSERARIDGLFPQVSERLLFMSSLLHRPWSVPDSLKSLMPRTPNADLLPALFQVARATGADNPITTGILRTYLARNVQVGGRRKAVNALLAAAARGHGLPEERLSLAAIDRETSQRGIRATVLDLVADPSVLEKVARERIQEVATGIQVGLGHDHDRPPVIPSNHDPLNGLAVTNDLLFGEGDQNLGWDFHLSVIFEPGTALSQMAFSPLGRTEGQHLDFSSVVIAPNRFQKQIGPGIDFFPSDDKNFSGAEVTTRIDVTDQIPIASVALFNDVAVTAPQSMIGDSGAEQFYL